LQKKTMRVLLFCILIALSGQLSAQDKPTLFDPLPQELTFKKKNIPIQNAIVSETEGVVNTREKFPFRTKAISKTAYEDGSVMTVYEIRGDYPLNTYLIMTKLKKTKGQGFYTRGVIINKDYGDAYLSVSENLSTIKFQKVDIHNIVCEMPKP
jgi:hypothetical protein